MFERYTEQARRAIFFARFEAIHQRSNEISTKHLLFGLSWDEDSRAVAVGSLKDKIVELCALMGNPHRPSTDVPYNSRIDIPLNRNVKMTLAYAAEESNKDQQFWIDTDHLLRGLLRFPNDASSALESIPLDLARARAASKRHRIGFPPQPIPASIRVRGGSGQALGMVAHPLLMVAIIASAEILLLFLASLLK
jgi:ATP-dependent Clp protease ATP-binding subunit ClpC